MIASATARALAVSAVHPIDTVKTKVQASRSGRSAVDALRRVLSESGVGGLYAGLDGAMIGQVPYSAIAFSVYETLKSALLPICPAALQVPCLLLCGSLGDLTGA
eukprot:tig00000411_g542.t1